MANQIGSNPSKQVNKKKTRMEPPENGKEIHDVASAIAVNAQTLVHEVCTIDSNENIGSIRKLEVGLQEINSRAPNSFYKYIFQIT